MADTRPTPAEKRPMAIAACRLSLAGSRPMSAAARRPPSTR